MVLSCEQCPKNRKAPPPKRKDRGGGTSQGGSIFWRGVPARGRHVPRNFPNPFWAPAGPQGVVRARSPSILGLRVLSTVARSARIDTKRRRVRETGVSMKRVGPPVSGRCCCPSTNCTICGGVQCTRTAR
eukprot:gene19077-biopygen20503